MSDDQRPVIIKPTVDASGVRPGTEEVKRTVADMAQAVGAEGRKAGEGFQGVGEGAKKGADRAERETGRMVAALQRLKAEADAGGKRNADYFESIAKQRGANLETLRPYLEAARAAEQAQKAATGSLGAMGVSAAQTAAALRQVPAQFTDIVTSLASGQAPLTVFLQQGGQLKDVFGGAGAAARALGGYVVSLVSPFTLVAGAVATLAAGYVMGSRESQEFTRGLVLSGNAAGTTADKLAGMARSIATTTSATQGKAAEVLTQIATSGDVAADSLERYTKAAIELERAGGPAAEETAKAFSSLARDPLAASIKLTETTRYLSAATAEQIRNLEEQGRTVEAARLAQNAYADAIEGRTPALVARLGTMERAWLSVKDAVKSTADAVLSIGRESTLQDQIGQMEARVAAMKRIQGQDGGGLLGSLFGNVADKQAQIESLREQARLADRAAMAQGENVRLQQAGVAWMKDGQQYLSSQAKFEQEIVRIRQMGAAAGKAEAEIAERVRAAVERTYGAQTRKSDATAEREREKSLREQAKLIAELSGVTGTYAQDLAALDAARRSGVVSEERYGELVRELVSRQPAVRDGMRELAKAAEEQAKATLRGLEASADYLASLDKRAEAGEKTLQNLQMENVELLFGKKAREQLELVELRRLAISYEQQAATADLLDGEEERYRKLAQQAREEIRLRESIADATEQRAVRDDMQREWQRTADQVGQSLADAIFEGGKSAGRMIQDYFRTLILQPVIKALVGPSAGAIASTVMPSAAGASPLSVASSAGSGLNLLGSLGGIGGAISTFGGSAGIGAGATLSGTGLGGLLSASGSMISGGSAVAGLGMGVGATIPYIAAAVAAYYVGKKLFGRELADSGVKGSFGAGGDFSGRAFQFYEGGLLRSDKTKTSKLGDQLEAVFDAGGKAANASATAYAKALGLPVEAIDGFTKDIKVSLKGLNAEKQQKAIEKAVEKYQEALLGQFSKQLGPLRKMGETLTQTAQRLAGLQIFSGTLNGLGGAFARLAGLSVDVREQFIAMAGGMDTLQQQAMSFAQNYYNRDEIAGIKAREVSGVLRSVGINQDISSRDQFRALVDGADVGTTAGREQLAALLAAGDEFAQVADYLAETGKTLSEAATLAPVTSELAKLFSEPAAAQVDAVNRVSDGVAQVNATLTSILTEVRRRPPQIVGWGQLETTGGA